MTVQTLLGWSYFIRKISSSVPKMDAPSGAVNAPTGNQTGRIIAAILEDVFTRWTTTAHGKLRRLHFEAPKLTSGRVGGVVGENSFKFFVQFVAYAFFYCLFVVIVSAIYLSEDLSTTVSLLSQLTLMYHSRASADLFPVRTERPLCSTCCRIWILRPFHFWDDMQLTTVRFCKPHDNRKLEQKTPRMATCCTDPVNIQSSSTG